MKGRLNDNKGYFMESARPFDHQFQRRIESLFRDDLFEEKATHITSMAILGIDDVTSSYLESASFEQVEVVQ